MILKNKYAGSRFQTMNEYYSELTTELDKLADLNPDGFRKHYILASESFVEEKCLPIRIPGGTVGSIYLDENDVITKIVIHTNYVVKTYQQDVNERIQHFVGERIEFA